MSAQFKDQNFGENAWIHELARAEIHPEAEGLFKLGKSYDPQQLVEESTIEFMTQVRECFTQFAQVLNGYSEAGSRFQELKIYSISQTPADFMLYRNQVKLVISNCSHGMIQIAFTRHVHRTYAVDAISTTDEVGSNEFGKPQELLAQIGAFRDVYWTYKDERVTPEQIAKFYFTEFVRTTRSAETSKGGNQVLLEEIKTFLQEKGIQI